MGKTAKSNQFNAGTNKKYPNGIMRKNQKRQPSFDEVLMHCKNDGQTLPSTVETTDVDGPCFSGKLASDFLNISEYKQKSLDARDAILDCPDSNSDDPDESECIPNKKSRVNSKKKVCFSNMVEVEEISADDYLDGQNSSVDEYEDIEFNFLKHNIHEISLESKNEFQITLYGETIVYIHGLIAVHVLKGSVQILGFKLNACDKKIFNVYSPAGSALLFISNCMKGTNSDNAVVLCKKLDTHLSQCLKLYAPKNLYPDVQENGTQCIANSANFFTDFSLFSPSPKWEGFANTLTATSRVIITGSKNTGKSTLLRYLVNHLLSSNADREGYTKVLVVDLDPGQAEFTPPGCISITIVKSPLLGPNYTHQQIPEVCIHISNIDVKYNMDEYIRCCKYLFNLLQNYRNIPTVINYIGYIKGLGQELISTIISFANPTNVVQINYSHSDVSSNFRKHLTIDNVKKDAKWIYDSTEQIDLSFKLDLFTTVHKYTQLNSLHYKAGQCRDIAIISYFSPILKGDPLCLTDPKVRIYAAPLDKLKIRDSSGNSHPAICNANLVSLCRKIPFEDSYIFMCLGWGIVRCISIPRNVIYLLTPVEFDLLEEIEYLVVSSVHLPLSMYITTAKDISGQIPYIEDGLQSDLEKPSKRQHYNKKLKY